MITPSAELVDECDRDRERALWREGERLGVGDSGGIGHASFNTDTKFAGSSTSCGTCFGEGRGLCIGGDGGGEVGLGGISSVGRGVDSAGGGT